MTTVTSTSTVVCFRCSGADYCIPVEATRGVRLATGLVPLPAPEHDVAGIIPGDPPLIVLDALGSAGQQVLVVEAGATTFGLLVDAVTGLRRIAESGIRPPPGGQARPFVCGTTQHGDQMLLVADPAALAARL